MKISLRILSIFILFSSVCSISWATVLYGNGALYLQSDSLVSEKRPYWEDETVFGENKEDGHATFMPYATTALLQADERYQKPWLTPSQAEFLSLNGLWHFRYSPDARTARTDFVEDLFDVSAWDTITVPSCWQMKGWDTPLYINVNHIFEDNPPFIRIQKTYTSAVDPNPTGSYRRDFILPAGWEKKRVYLHFDGLYSGAYVWINGRYIGYTQGGNNDAEFDISAAVRAGQNNVNIQVVRWTDASYLEGQDMFHMSGLHRDVYLYATPRTSIRDHYITSKLHPESDYTTGEISVAVEMDNRDGSAARKTVGIRLLDPQGKVLWEERKQTRLSVGEQKQSLHFRKADLRNLSLWTAETPTLYTLIITQWDEKEHEELAFATKYGFRQPEIRDQSVYLNGRKVLFKGVNTQDTHPLHGRSIDLPTMVKDITMMKQANVNTLRTSHYPRQPKMYALCDYYGLYVMDEADLECHKNWDDHGEKGGITNAESWRAQYVDRTVRMVCRDRNHPSVLFWSLGNESGGGENFRHTYAAVRALDSRIIHYEGATRGGTEYTDLHSVMYPSLAQVQAGANGRETDGKPYFMCEYAHAMGNGVGNLQDYWDIMEQSSAGIGGCIWDWVDQAIYDPFEIKRGLYRLHTGYDYPGPHQGNFVNNGLVTADRSWTPKLYEVKKVYQYVKFDAYDSKSKLLTLHNAYSFTDLNRFGLRFKLLSDGCVIESGEVDLPKLPAGEKATLRIPVADIPMYSTRDFHINFELFLREATTWADKGYTVASEQFTLAQREGFASLLPERMPTLQVTTEGNHLHIANDRVQLVFDLHTAELICWNYGSHPVIIPRGGPVYDNFRWVENDSPYGSIPPGAPAGLVQPAVPSYEVNADSTRVILVTSHRALCPYRLNYYIYGDGTVDIRADFTPEEEQADKLRRLGIKMCLPLQMDRIEYLARGPHENYVDRRQSAFFGLYSDRVSRMVEPYVRPQSTGNRTGLRALTLTDDSGRGIRVEASGQVDFSILPYEDEHLARTRHQWELPMPAHHILRFDYMQRGLGNGSCGPGTAPAYLCPSSGTYSFELRFRPL